MQSLSCHTWTRIPCEIAWTSCSCDSDVTSKWKLTHRWNTLGFPGNHLEFLSQPLLWAKGFFSVKVVLVLELSKLFKMVMVQFYFVFTDGYRLSPSRYRYWAAVLSLSSFVFLFPVVLFSGMCLVRSYLSHLAIIAPSEESFFQHSLLSTLPTLSPFANT